MIEVEQSRPLNAVMTFDEVSMERSKSFVKALQELKNLRPQLYSAAEYCEKSFLHSEQKQMVLDNLKDYAVRALVNAVDHLGTVAYKLTDLLEQQTSEVSTIELNISCVNQQLLTCQTYMSREGLRQQQLLAFIPRHHKHYILPNSVNKRVHFSPHIQTDAVKNSFQARAHLRPSGIPASKTLSWHLASEMKSTLKGIPHASTSTEDARTSGKTSEVFHLVDVEETSRTKSSAAHLRLLSGGPASGAIVQTSGTTVRDAMESSKALTTYRSFENQNRRAIVHVPVRSKSVLSSFFVKQKTSKMKAGSVA
ncbi:protein ABIL1 isoform X1 [Juglans microcarpa x Juglans regia]|uniref:protein ABIL1 isoform X1 n=1 Tax=Juglans microcarpa x Juglans regia TaxID=2249226 RepID=UPI001B7F6C9F|nr:protein ABIL1 isoform X1 [Juglans microcarpa x Juglans regia]